LSLLKICHDTRLIVQARMAIHLAAYYFFQIVLAGLFCVSSLLCPLF
jgi:hypothetical protein